MTKRPSITPTPRHAYVRFGHRAAAATSQNSRSPHITHTADTEIFASFNAKDPLKVSVRRLAVHVMNPAAFRSANGNRKKLRIANPVLVRLLHETANNVGSLRLW
jgi:hypothetical protein